MIQMQSEGPFCRKLSNIYMMGVSKGRSIPKITLKGFDYVCIIYTRTHSSILHVRFFFFLLLFPPPPPSFSRRLRMDILIQVPLMSSSNHIQAISTSIVYYSFHGQTGG